MSGFDQCNAYLLFQKFISYIPQRLGDLLPKFPLGAVFKIQTNEHFPDSGTKPLPGTFTAISWFDDECVSEQSSNKPGGFSSPSTWDTKLQSVTGKVSLFKTSEASCKFRSNESVKICNYTLHFKRFCSGLHVQRATPSAVKWSRGSEDHSRQSQIQPSPCALCSKWRRMWTILKSKACR